MAQNRQYHKVVSIQGGSTEHFHADRHYHGSDSPHQHRERHGYYVIILAVMLMNMGTEDMRTSYYSHNTQNMNRENMETWVAPGEKHFHKAEGNHPQNTEDIVQNVNINNYHNRRHSSPDNQQRKYWDITIPQRGQFPTVRRPSSPEQQGRYSSPECQCEEGIAV